jgi:hypothetical protein
MNIFLITQDPKVAFGAIVGLLPRTRPWFAAYRSLDDDAYVDLHPPGVDQFVVK